MAYKDYIVGNIKWDYSSNDSTSSQDVTAGKKTALTANYEIRLRNWSWRKVRRIGRSEQRGFFIDSYGAI